MEFLTRRQIPIQASVLQASSFLNLEEVERKDGGIALEKATFSQAPIPAELCSVTNTLWS